MFEVALHGGVFLFDKLIHVVVHFVLVHCRVYLNWLVVHDFYLLDGIQPFQTESYLWLPYFLDDSFVHPERHFLLYDVRNYA